MILKMVPRWHDLDVTPQPIEEVGFGATEKGASISLVLLSELHFRQVDEIY